MFKVSLVVGSSSVTRAPGRGVAKSVSRRVAPSVVAVARLGDVQESESSITHPVPVSESSLLESYDIFVILHVFWLVKLDGGSQ